MERHLKALLIALALLALYAVPVAAQNGSITIELNCFEEPEGVTITNDTDEDIVLTGITSSFEADGDPERNFDLTIASGDTETAAIGDQSAGGSDNIFNNEKDESATVYVADDDFEVSCEAPETFQIGVSTVQPTEPPVEATEPPQPTVGPQQTPTPEVDDKQDEDVDDEQHEGDSPEEMPDTGAGGFATGASVPLGQLSLAASGLLAAGYAVIRRR